MGSVFLIILQYIKPHFAIEHYAKEHKQFLMRYVDKGNFICCGSKKLKTGEFILCTAENRKEVQKIVADDPFDQYQLAVYEIEEYNLTASDHIFAQREMDF